MAIEFKLPELGENISSADVTKILVSVGDTVKKEQPLLELETDKASMEVPSEVEGTVKEIKIKEGDKAKVGQVLIVFENSGSAKAESAKVEEVKAEEPAKKNEPAPETKPAIKESASSAGGVYEFRLPELGENISKADVTKIMVKAGDRVKKDQPLIELETDKASMEVPSEVEGTVKEIKINEGDSASVGQVIIVFETGSASATVEEKVPEKPAAKPESEVKQESKPFSAPAVMEEREIKQEVKSLYSQVKKEEKSGLLAPAAPSVRRFAREIGIKVSNVRGTGPGGRISVDDVKKYAKGINEQIESGAGFGGGVGVKAEPLPDFSKFGEIDVQPMSNVRRKTAEHLSYAWATVPHVTQFDKADITDLEKLRKMYGKIAEAAGGKLTVTAILLKVIASALKKFPQFNASVNMSGSEVIYKKYVNIGVAVDTDRGLIVPVIRNVDKKNIIQLAAELAEISRKARDKKITLDDLQGGNFSISNLGGIGGTAFSPIVNTPEVAILGVSRGEYEPKYIDGQFEPRLMLPLSLSYDHRLIDGADGARFIRWVASALEQPLLMSLEG